MSLSRIIDSTWSQMSGFVKMAVAVGLTLLIILLLWFYGTKTRNAISRWWYNREVKELQQKLNQTGHELDQAKTLIHQLQGEYAAEKQAREKIQAEREELEKVLANQSATTNAKLAQLRKLLAQPVTPIDSGISDRELCERSAALGIPCN